MGFNLLTMFQNKKLCTHSTSIHIVLDIYLREGEEDKWISHDENREVNRADLKVKCSYCGCVFLKKSSLIFRNKITGEYCN